MRKIFGRIPTEILQLLLFGVAALTLVCAVLGSQYLYRQGRVLTEFNYYVEIYNEGRLISMGYRQFQPLCEIEGEYFDCASVGGVGIRPFIMSEKILAERTLAGSGFAITCSADTYEIWVSKEEADMLNAIAERYSRLIEAPHTFSVPDCP